MDTLTIAELREALTNVCEESGAWNQNIHQSKKVVIRIGDEYLPLTRVLVNFIPIDEVAQFALILDAG